MLFLPKTLKEHTWRKRHRHLLEALFTLLYPSVFLNEGWRCNVPTQT